MVRTMSEIILARWMKCATDDMVRNNRTDIRCPCRRCKLECVTEPGSGVLQNHLMRNGFMDGYTRWISDEDGEEDVDGGAPGNEEGQQDNNGEGGREDEEPPGHDHEEDAGADHEDQDAGHEHEDQQDTGHEDSSWVRDPHVQALLGKEARNARGAAREKARLAQLEKDAVTDLYEGCNDGDTRLNVTLGDMEMKEKHKWTDESFDDNMAI